MHLYVLVHVPLSNYQQLIVSSCEEFEVIINLSSTNGTHSMIGRNYFLTQKKYALMW